VLFKQGGLVKNWKYRFFQLSSRDHTLKYFRPQSTDVSAGLLIGVINLADYEKGFVMFLSL